MRTDDLELPMDVRGSVSRFARMMEKVLKIHDQRKGGWEDTDLRWLFMKLIEEVGEVGEIFTEIHSSSGNGGPYFISDVIAEERVEAAWEAVDVANIAMMIAEKLLEPVTTTRFREITTVPQEESTSVPQKER